MSGQPLPKTALPAAVWALDPKRRQVIEDRLAILSQIAAAPGGKKRRTIHEIAEANKGKRGFAAPTLTVLYCHWQRVGQDWRVLDAYRALYRPSKS